MNRQQYIQLKSTNPAELAYLYYKEKFDVTKHKPQLNRNEFFMYIQAYSDINSIVNYAIGEYDRKFDVVLLISSDGKYIKSL